MSNEAPYAPVRVLDLAKEGRLVWLHCTACFREREVLVASLAQPMTISLPALKRRLVCWRRGSRNIDVRPQLHAKPLEQIRREAQT